MRWVFVAQRTSMSVCYGAIMSEKAATGIHVIVFETWQPGEPEDPKNAVALVKKKLEGGCKRGDFICGSAHGLENCLKTIVGLAQGRRIDCLDLIGHGRPGAFSFGAQLGAQDRVEFPRTREVDNVTGLLRADDSLTSAFWWLKEIGIVGSETKIRLLGCATAVGSNAGDGPLLLHHIAVATGCVVFGTTGPFGPDDFDERGLNQAGEQKVVKGPARSDSEIYTQLLVDVEPVWLELLNLVVIPNQWVFQKRALATPPLVLDYDYYDPLVANAQIIADGLFVRCQIGAEVKYFPRGTTSHT